MKKTTRPRKSKDQLPFKSVLARLMAERGLTVAQVAGLAGVSRTVAHDWASGRTPQDLVAVGKLARALNVSLRELILGEPEDSVAVAHTAAVPGPGAFDEVDLFDGHVRIIIRKLVPSGQGGKPDT